MRAEPHRLVLIDETSVKTNLTRLCGRAPVGERLKGTAPFGRWQTQTFIAGLTSSGVIAPWVLDGAMNAIAFETYIATQLAPLLEPGTVVILDNLSTHRSPGAAKALKTAQMLVPLPAAIQPRSKSHRTGFCQAQGASETVRRMNLRRTHSGNRRHL